MRLQPAPTLSTPIKVSETINTRRFELSLGAIMSTCLHVNRSRLQFFFAALFSFVALARATDLEQGRAYPFAFADVEGRRFFLSDGRATLLTVATRETEPKAHRVGNTVPDQYVGHPHYRYVTIINFQNRIPRFLRRVIAAIVRRRFRSEADAVQPRYSARKIDHSPRADLFAIADFDGGAVRQLGIQPASNDFAVFVFDGRGQLIRRWRDVPARDELARALSAAQF